ncbi:MAG: ABC transporter permease [Burkholderiaceae bacterium]|nr:ABC transporter permease [Burkholderiaceae bacterium]
MAATNPASKRIGPIGALRQALVSWWQIVHLGAVMLVLAVSPSSHRAARRRQLAWHLVAVCAPMLPGFTVVGALISLVIIRIVTVTALSYGLSQYALEMVVRVLMLELIPLAAALFAALRATLPMAAEIAALRSAGHFDALARQGCDPRADEVLPRVLAGMFAVLLLAAVSCALTLLLAYLSVHGVTLGGFERYTRTVGRIFDPAVSLIFALKVLLLAGAVALIPIASALQAERRPGGWSSAELQSLVRMFLVILLIEAASLVGNYY